MSSSQSLPPPQPAYKAPPNAPIYRSPELLQRIAAAPREQIESFVIPPRSGHAFVVAAGCLARITTPEGPQVGDLNIWNLHNPRERFWAARTRQIHASHVKVGDRLWSCLPYLRPLVTITADSIGSRGYGSGEAYEGRCHDLLGTRCDPYVNKLITTTVDEAGDVVSEGEGYDFHCHSNLTRAILPHGLAEHDVHDGRPLKQMLNVFQVTGLDKDGKYFMRTCPAKVGDFFEFFAETDVLCALSTCPGGDLSQWGWSDDSQSMLECCRPLGVEVLRITDASVLKGWKSPRPAYELYRGLHGMKLPHGETQV